MLNWSGDDITKILDIYLKYESLRGTDNENYMKKNARETSFKKLMQELTHDRFQISGDEILRREIKFVQHFLCHFSTYIVKNKGFHEVF